MNRWSRALVLQLEEYVACGWSDRYIARRMGRSIVAVEVAMKRHGVHRRDHLMRAERLRLREAA